MKKLIAEQNQKKDHFASVAIMLLVVFVSLLLVAKVIMANRLVEASGQLRDLDRKIATISAANDELAESVRVSSSLVHLEAEAKAAGFVKESKFSVIRSQEKVALELLQPSLNEPNQ